MRFVVAIVSFVIAFLMIGYGIAQRTILAEPDQVAVTAEVPSDAAVTVIDGAVLNANSGRQKIELSGSDTIFAAYGRTNDVLAWVGKARYNEIGFDAETSTLTSTLVRGTEAAVPDPRNSDLWLGEYFREGELSFVVNVPEDISVIITSDGTAPAPDEISLSWPVDNRTPWSGPLIAGGVLLLLIGLGLYLWGLADLRKARGPRRKPPKTPKMPKPPRRRRYKPNTPVLKPTKGRRSAARMTVLLPTVLIGTLALSACSADYWPDFVAGDPSSTPTPLTTEAAEPVSTAKPPAVTVTQLQGIIAEVAAVAQKGDADKDAELIASRFAGPALEMRAANYAIRKVDNSYAPLAAIPAGDIRMALPQQTETWPRTVFSVVQEREQEVPLGEEEPAEKPAPIAPTAMMLVQESPRDNFKVVYAVSLTANTQLPEVAAAEVGAVRVSDTEKFFSMLPSEIAMNYGDVLLLGSESEHVDMFDLENDTLVTSIGAEKKAEQKKALPSIASIAFSNALGNGETIAMVTNDNGALVAVYLNESEVVKPVEAGAEISAEGAVKSLSGIGTTTKGTVATYGDQLLFYVPPSTSDEKIVLLGWASELISAKELS